MFENHLHKLITEKLDTGLTHQQVYDELKAEGDDNRAIVRILMRIPSKASFEATKSYRTIIQFITVTYILFGIYFINNILKPSLSHVAGLWLQFGLFAAAMLMVSVYFLQRKALPNFIMLIIPVAYFSFLNKIIPQQFTAHEIVNLVLFLLVFILEISYTYKLKKGIDLKV